MHPGAGNKILIRPCKFAARAVAQRDETGDGSFEIRVEPAGNVQRRNLDPIESRANALRSPVLAWFAMRNPVTHIIGQRRVGDCWMRAVRNVRNLRADVGPSSFQSIARLAQTPAPRILAQHLNAPS